MARAGGASVLYIPGTPVTEEKPMGSYELKANASGQYMFNLKAANGQIILTSEQYEAKDSALNGIASVQANSPDGDRYELLTSKGGDPYFVLKAANGQTIGRSEMYSSAGACDNGIESVKTNGPSTDIDDQTG